VQLSLNGESDIAPRSSRGSRNKWLLMGIVQQDRPNFPQRWQTAQNWKLKTQNRKRPQWSTLFLDTPNGAEGARGLRKPLPVFGACSKPLQKRISRTWSENQTNFC